MNYFPTRKKLASLGFAPTALLAGFHFYAHRLGTHRLVLRAEPAAVILNEYDPVSRVWPRALMHIFRPVDEAAFDATLASRGWRFTPTPTPTPGA